MKSYRILLPFFLFFFLADHITVEAAPKVFSKKNSQQKGKKKIKTSHSKKAKKNKNRNMSMFAKEIHPGDKMLVDNFGKQVGFEPQDFSKIDEKDVCSKKACKADVDQSTCYRGFRGNIQRPEKGCQGYQRRTMGTNIGKVKKGTYKGSTDNVISRPGRKPTVGALDDGSLDLDVLEANATNVQTNTGSTKPSTETGDPSAAIAGIAGIGAVGLLAHNLTDDDDDNVIARPDSTTYASGTTTGPAAAMAAASGGTTPVAPTLPAGSCTAQADVEALGDEIKAIHTAELSGLGTDPVGGSENPQTSHQALYDMIISQLAYLATITDLTQLNSGIDIIVGRLNMLIGTNSIQSHFTQNLANKIISAVSCIKSIGNPLAINQNIGWMGEKMAD